MQKHNPKFSVVRIKTETLKKLREMAERNELTAPQLLDVLVELGAQEIVDVTALPHPEDAQPIPLVTVKGN